MCKQKLECKTHIKISTGISESWCKKCDLPRITEVPYFRSSWDAGHKILKYEGVRGLWRGLPPALIMAIPSTAFYFSVYDVINQKGRAFAQSMDYPESLSPLISGTSARALTTIGVSPLELVRTQQQATNTATEPGGRNPKLPSMLYLTRREINLRGFSSLWRGVGPTLWRDVPFSAMYWTSLELIRDILMDIPDFTDHSLTSWNPRVASSFVAGAVAGVLACTVTHPFDVAKTRQQIASLDLLSATGRDVPSIVSRPALTLIREIARQEGAVALYAGLGARQVKIAPACAIMLSSYELAKSMFSNDVDVSRAIS